MSFQVSDKKIRTPVFHGGSTHPLFFSAVPCVYNNSYTISNYITPRLVDIPSCFFKTQLFKNPSQVVCRSRGGSLSSPLTKKTVSPYPWRIFHGFSSPQDGISWSILWQLAKHGFNLSTAATCADVWMTARTSWFWIDMIGHQHIISSSFTSMCEEKALTKTVHSFIYVRMCFLVFFTRIVYSLQN